MADSMPKQKKSCRLLVSNYNQKQIVCLGRIQANNSDGGIQFIPDSGSAPGYEFGVMEATEYTPASAALGALKNNPPKLHYHASGYAAVRPTRPGPYLSDRKSEVYDFKLPPMDSLDGHQIFSLHAAIPGPFERIAKIRKDDLCYVMDQPGAKALRISGIIYRRTNIPAITTAHTNPSSPISLTRGSRQMAFIDLSGHGRDSIFLLNFESANEFPAANQAITASFFHRENIDASGAVYAGAGKGRPLVGLMEEIPDLQSILSSKNGYFSESILENIPENE